MVLAKTVENIALELIVIEVATQRQLKGCERLKIKGIQHLEYVILDHQNNRKLIFYLHKPKSDQFGKFCSYLLIVLCFD